MDALSICSGVGMLDYAAEEAGIHIIGQVEKDAKCRRVLRKHFPNTPIAEDLRTFNGDEFGHFHLLFGGIPCQPYSGAGKKRGEADARDLWPDTIRIIRRVQPRWVLIENVANFTNLALDRVWADLEAAEYQVGACVLPACAFGAPHKRERCFTLAYSAGESTGRTYGQREGRQHTLRSEDSLAHASGERLQGCWTVPGKQELRHSSGRVGASGIHRLLESNVDRAVDGIVRRLDGLHWPTTPGKAQAEWEAPRVIADRLPEHSSRLKQLGNGVVWQQAYPFFALMVAINSALEGRD